MFQGGGPTVVAPSAGRVLFAGAFRTYGSLVIIDSCDVDVLVAGMKTVATHAQALIKKAKPSEASQTPEA